MRLFDATLDLARFAQGIETHKITGVLIPGEHFSCGSLGAKLGEYSHGGTCWFLNGEAEGWFGEIENASNSVVHLRDHCEKEFGAGDSVALSWFHYFNTQNLINAVNHVLYDYPIMDVYEFEVEESSYKHNVYEYELPDEVSLDVRRVEIQSKNWYLPFPNTLPDTFTVCHYWQLRGRTLVIDPRWIYKWKGRIKVYYAKPHGMIIDPETETISEQVDKNYLRKMANLWLWQHEIQMKHKDNPIAVDMFNQAKMDEESLNKKNIPETRLMPKDLTYFW